VAETVDRELYIDQLTQDNVNIDVTDWVSHRSARRVRVLNATALYWLPNRL